MNISSVSMPSHQHARLQKMQHTLTTKFHLEQPLQAPDRNIPGQIKARADAAIRQGHGGPVLDRALDYVARRLELIIPLQNQPVSTETASRVYTQNSIA